MMSSPSRVLLLQALLLACSISNSLSFTTISSIKSTTSLNNTTRRSLQHHALSPFSKIFLATRGGDSDSNTSLEAQSSDDDDDVDSSDTDSYNFDSSSDSSDYESSSSSASDEEDILHVDVITDESQTAINAKPMPSLGMDESIKAQQSQSYFLSSILWLSLAMDIILNKPKRASLFPGAAAVGGKLIIGGRFLDPNPQYWYHPSNLIMTMNLASGFLASAGLCFIISRQFESTSTDDEDETSSSSNTASTTIFDSDEESNSRIRKRLQFLLSTFGILNLGPYLNSVSQAPFLGMSGAVIGIINILTSVNGWTKEVELLKKENNDEDSGKINYGTEVSSGIKSALSSLLGGGTNGSSTMTGFQKTSSSGGDSVASNMYSYIIFMVAAQIAALRGIGVVFGSLIPHYTKCFAAGTLAIGPVDALQKIGLEWATLSRAVIASGICLTLKEEAARGRLKTSLSQSLNAMVAVLALLAVIPRILLNTDKSSVWRLLVVAAISGSNAMKKYRFYRN